MGHRSWSKPGCTPASANSRAACVVKCRTPRRPECGSLILAFRPVRGAAPGSGHQPRFLPRRQVGQRLAVRGGHEPAAAAFGHLHHQVEKVQAHSADQHGAPGRQPTPVHVGRHIGRQVVQAMPSGRILELLLLRVQRSGHMPQRQHHGVGGRVVPSSAQAATRRRAVPRPVASAAWTVSEASLRSGPPWSAKVQDVAPVKRAAGKIGRSQRRGLLGIVRRHLRNTAGRYRGAPGLESHPGHRLGSHVFGPGCRHTVGNRQGVFIRNNRDWPGCQTWPGSGREGSTRWIPQPGSAACLLVGEQSFQHGGAPRAGAHDRYTKNARIIHAF